MPGWVTELMKLMTPNSSAAFATVTAPPGSISCNEPIGASITGSRTFSPNRVAEVSTFLTSRRMRGQNARASSAIRLRLRVVSDSEPPIR